MPPPSASSVADPRRLGSSCSAPETIPASSAKRARPETSAACFFLCPDQDAIAQAVWLHQFLHEADLVEAGFEEELRERRQGFFAQSASPVEIIASRRVAGGKVPLVAVFIAGEATRNRPDAACIKRLQQDSVRHQPRYASVAVEERVNPQQAVMRRSRGEEKLRFTSRSPSSVIALPTRPPPSIQPWTAT